MVKRRYCISLIPLTKLTSFKLALNSPHRNLRLHSSSGKQIQWVPRADACDGFLCLKQDIWPRNELDIVVSKSASFAMVRRKKIKWRVVVIVEPWYILHTFFLCTRATPAIFFMKPTVTRYITWVQLKYMSLYGTSAQIFDLFPKYMIFICDFYYGSLAIKVCTKPYFEFESIFWADEFKSPTCKLQ